MKDIWKRRNLDIKLFVTQEYGKWHFKAQDRSDRFESGKTGTTSNGSIPGFLTTSYFWKTKNEKLFLLSKQSVKNIFYTFEYAHMLLLLLYSALPARSGQDACFSPSPNVILTITPRGR